MRGLLYTEDIKPFTPNEVVHTEFYLLEALECDLIVFHPYRCLPSYVADINLDIIDIAWYKTFERDRIQSCASFSLPIYETEGMKREKRERERENNKQRFPK